MIVTYAVANKKKPCTIVLGFLFLDGLQSRSIRIGFYKNKGELEKFIMSKKRDNGTGK